MSSGTRLGWKGVHEWGEAHKIGGKCGSSSGWGYLKIYSEFRYVQPNALTNSNNNWSVHEQQTLVDEAIKYGTTVKRHFLIS